jgi:hypothetical protein
MMGFTKKIKKKTLIAAEFPELDLRKGPLSELRK